MRLLGDRILLRRIGAKHIEDTTESGIILPNADVYQEHMQGEIVAVGPQVEEPLLLPGLRVICGRYKRAIIDDDMWVTFEDNIAALLVREDSDET